MPFCSSCGKELSPRAKFCGHCGAFVELAGAPPSPQAAPPSPPPPPPPPPAPQNIVIIPPAHPQIPPDSASAPVSDAPPSPVPQILDGPLPPPPAAPAKVPVSPKNVKIIIAVVAVLVVIAGVYFIVVPNLSGMQSTGTGSAGLTTQTPVTTIAPPVTTIPTQTTVPTPTPELFPDALPRGTWFNFSSGKTASQATVYDTWINDTYRWHNDADNKWYIQEPKAGNKYLLIFINIVNRGDTRVWYPKSGSIAIHYNNQIIKPDPMHYIPEKSGGNTEATPIEIDEVQYRPNLFDSEYVQDYGLSHGTKSDFVYPGESNAIDGYLIYEVPSSLTLDKAYADIEFNGQDRAVWKLE